MYMPSGWPLTATPDAAVFSIAHAARELRAVDGAAAGGHRQRVGGHAGVGRPGGASARDRQVVVALFRSDATFCPQAGKSGQGTSFASFNFPTRFIRHFNSTLFIASNGGSNNFDATASWAADVSWAVSSPWTP